MSEEVKNETVNNEAANDETVNEDVNENVTAEEKNHRITIEEFKVSGEAIVSKVKEVIREGNIRRITLKNEEGKTLLEIPLTLGVVGGLLLPTLAAIGAIGALIANLSITVERVEKDEVVAEGEDSKEEVALEASI